VELNILTTNFIKCVLFFKDSPLASVKKAVDDALFLPEALLMT